MQPCAICIKWSGKQKIIINNFQPKVVAQLLSDKSLLRLIYLYFNLLRVMGQISEPSTCTIKVEYHVKA